MNLHRAKRPDFRSVALIAGAIGAVAVGAFAIGALAIGWLAVRRVRIDRAEIESLAIQELTVTRLRAGEVIVSESLQLPQNNVDPPDLIAKKAPKKRRR